MTPLSIQVPFPVFQDRDGQPLDNGYVWIGQANLNPQTNPVVAYYDASLTIIAAQPLRTINGYVSRAGTPAQLYVDGVNFSILVQDSKGSMVYNFPDGTGISPDACGVTYNPPFTGAVPYPVCEKLEQTVSIMDFGAVSGSNIVAATNTALTALGTTNPATLVIPTGSWLVSSTVDWSAYKNVTFVIENGAVINHGANNITFPQNVETGTSINNCFVGAGTVTVKNKDVFALTPPPGGWLTYSNYAIGINALESNTEGTNNFAWGANALRSNTLGSSNIAIGNDTLKTVQGTHTVPVGTFSCTGWNNICIGDSAGRDVTTGFENLGIGALTHQRLTTGAWNVAVGHDSQILNQTGSSNTSIGAYALVTSLGSNNTAMGWAALENQVSGSNTAVGFVAMNANNSGTGNSVFGADAMRSSLAINKCVVVGQEAMKNVVSGADQCTIVGTEALGQMTTGGGTNTTAIGFQALLTLSSGDNNTAIGAGCLNSASTVTNCFGIGASAQVTGSNQGQLGDSAVTTYAYGAVQNRSDVRDKTDVQDTALGLSFIKTLRPVDYRFDYRDDYRKGTEPLAEIVADGSKKRTRFHHGLIAQEVKTACDVAGVDFGGYQDHKINGGDDVLSIGYEEFIAPLIKAVQELSAEVEALKAKIN